MRTLLASYEFGEIKNFFRRSGFYSMSREREGQVPTAEALFDRFEKAISQRIRYTYLALIESVAFAEDKMDFASFAVRRFTRAELEAKLQIGVVRTFYPYGEVDTATLEDYWFIYAEEEIEESPFRLDRPMESSPPLKREFTEFPTPIETALRKLALFDWKSWMVDNAEGWFGFNIPFVLAVNDNLLEAPNTAPDLGKLPDRPSFDSGGNELGYAPDFLTTVGGSEVAAFVRFIAEVEGSVAKVEGVPEWDFLNRALGYLIKAYFSDGLEQVLWHTTVLDALLGAKANVTESLRRRVSLILGPDDQERQNLRKQIDNLYDLRSKLVHGKAMAEHSRERLFEARCLARRTALYFINFLASSREKILEMIDIGKSGVPAMSQSLEVLNRLPEKFPSVAAWS